MYTSQSFDLWMKYSARKPKEQRVPGLQARRLRLQVGRQWSSSTTSQLSQRAIVKISYAPPSHLARHVSYIERDGKGIERSKPELFTKEGQSLPTGKISGEERFFRMILSPENGARLDMEKYTRDFMHKVDNAHPGGDLQWFAAIHYNTDNPHTHIVIRGVDSYGQDVLFTREFITQHARRIASELATGELGFRSQHEIKAQREREITADRFTSLDRGILRNTDPRGVVVPHNQTQLERLDFLRLLHLAHKNQDNSFQLDRNWKTRLEYDGRQHDIIKTIYNDMPPDLKKKWIARGTGKHLSIYQTSWTVQGAVTAMGVADELFDRAYLIIESNGKPYYLSDRNLDLNEHQIGDQVTLCKGQLTTLSQAKQPGLAQDSAQAVLCQAKFPEFTNKLPE